MDKLIDATAEHRDQIDESFLSPSARIRLAGTGQGAGQEPSGTLGGGSVGLLAVACGIAVANAYYAQPLLVEIGQSLRLSDLAVGLIPALTQIGVAAGVLLLLPLGDVIPARRLLTVAIIFQAIALAATSLAPSGSVLIAMSLVIGFFGITPYVLPPYATLRTSAQRRGHVTALLVQGIIVGMLLAILLDMARRLPTFQTEPSSSAFAPTSGPGWQRST